MAGVIEREGSAARGDRASGESFSLVLELTVQDRDTIAELCAFPEGEARDEFALNALRIGVLALRQARGQLDADLIQRETQRMLCGLQGQLGAHAAQMHEKLTAALKEYFDPTSGRFHERVQQLVKQDGDLEQLLRRQIGGEDSELCRTLVAHVGEQSALMKLLNPRESQGLMAALRETVEAQLTAQSTHVLREFSLDNKEGALARLVGELTANHGQLTKTLEGKIEDVVREFSLDEENSALSRLVKNVDRAQRTISSEFSLDNDHSALSRLKDMMESTSQAIHRNLTLDDETSSLARLKRELLTILSAHCETNQRFQEDVKVSLNKMLAKREEAARSTRHGNAFEDAVCEFLQRQAQNKCDTFSATGADTGLIKNCKVGDAVIELGSDCVAEGARIVVEAKEEQGYSPADARKEIDRARENRGAQVGLFVVSRKTAADGWDPLHRAGDDVFVVWDAEDATTDVYLHAGLELARALCIRGSRQSDAQAADFTALDVAILEIDKRAGALAEISTWAETIQNNSEKILDHVRKTRKSLERQVETLREKLSDLKQSMQSTAE